MSNLYTVVVWYLGGTYISQSTAIDEHEALDNWVVSFANHSATAKWAALLFEDSDVDGLGRDLTALDTLKNVWYTTIDGANGGAEIQIIRTAD
jgi:hypothetical protein